MMIKSVVRIGLIGLSLWIVQSFAVVSAQSVIEKYSTYNKNYFPLVQEKGWATLYIDSIDAKVVTIAAQALCGDIELISGLKPSIDYQTSQFKGYPVIIGTIGHSEAIDQLIQSGKIDVQNIRYKWEAYQMTIIDKPFKGVKKALVIAGSDRRGTAYGVFELSKLLGVSPWVWWADVVPEKQKEIFLTNGTIESTGPSVKYRGIFLNDEDWGLKPWAASKMDPDIQDIGPKTYAHIFELLLRLKANFIWPAMHDCTKAFYYYPENPKVADDYAIVVGSSHCEPILRNNVFEWNINFENEYGVKPGEWRYDLNKDQILKYWGDRAGQSSKYESVYTIGMRGIHDGSMPGPKEPYKKVQLLSQVINDQRELLQDKTGLPINEIPQIFCPYKEVLTLYQKGLNLPDDVTIVWADDNHGYIRQLSDATEQLRSGRSGVYYHLSYWGDPHDYLWLSSISPSLMGFELQKAFEYGADRLWVINVGDIKPAEMEMQFALDMAWDINLWNSSTAKDYPTYWGNQTFGIQRAGEFAAIKKFYYNLAQAAKPEHMAKVKFTDAQSDERLADYARLDSMAGVFMNKIPPRLHDAAYQLVKYPVSGARLMNEKILYAQKSLSEMAQGHDTCLYFARRSQNAFEDIQKLTTIYNNDLADGKWNGIMSWKPRNLDVFKMPKVATTEELQKAKKQPVASGPEDDGFIKVFQANDYSKLFVDGDGLQFEMMDGLGAGGCGLTVKPFNWYQVKPDTVKIDPALSSSSVKNVSSDTSSVVIIGPDKKVEGHPVLMAVPGLKLMAPMADFQLHLEAGNYTIEIHALPTEPVNESRKMRYAVSLNNDPWQTVDLSTPEKTVQWGTDVLRGYHKGVTKHKLAKAGNVTISIAFLDPGLVINQVIVRPTIIKK